MELLNKKICFLGDSITEGVGTSAPEYRYCDLLLRDAKLGGIENCGISGTRIARQRVINPATEYWDRNSFCERVGGVGKNADIIVVFGGTNDYGHGDALFGEPSDRGMDSYIGAVHYLMKSLREQNPGAKVVFMTPLHREGDRNGSTANGLPLKAYVDAIVEIAPEYDVEVLDLFNLSGIVPDRKEDKEAYCPDGLHPNDAGHRIIEAKLKSFLEAM